MKKFVFVFILLIYSFLNVNVLFAGIGTWTRKADVGGSSRMNGAGFCIGDKGYIGLGSFSNINDPKDFWEYNPAADNWTQKANYAGAGDSSYSVGFSIGNKGYVLTEASEFYEFDPQLNKWTKRADFNGTRRYLAVGFSMGSKGYIGTGKYDNPTFPCLNDLWEYNPVTDSWTQKIYFGPLPAERYGAVGFSIGSKGYIGTGMYENRNTWGGRVTTLKDFWEYDPSKNIWTQEADFGGVARYRAVGFSIGSKGYIGSGESTPDFWEYDPDTNIWTQKASEGTGRYAAVGFSIGSKGYIGTGWAQDGWRKDFWEFDPAGHITPEQFTFTDQTDVARNKTITSNTITVSGITTSAPISISGGTYSINGGAYSSESGTVNNGDAVSVQKTSSESYSTTTNATLTIGGVSDTFSVTTKKKPANSEDGGGGRCFIATAAFGSPLARQVGILRQFRDGYLLTNSAGRKFVDWYYHHSPIAANFIKDKPFARMIVRMALYPLIGFSFLLIYGYLPFAIIGVLLPALLYSRFKLKKTDTM